MSLSYKSGGMFFVFIYIQESQTPFWDPHFVSLSTPFCPSSFFYLPIFSPFFPFLRIKFCFYFPWKKKKNKILGVPFLILLFLLCLPPPLLPPVADDGGEVVVILMVHLHPAAVGPMRFGLSHLLKHSPLKSPLMLLALLVVSMLLLLFLMFSRWHHLSHVPSPLFFSPFCSSEISVHSSGKKWITTTKVIMISISWFCIIIC